ncbi:hypothetical protein A1D22_03145 [Pasteurellaceae bacterium LFhippo2]|nr:hypothetical protein [Pasteurellaceae bacterium LFhippo2]
MLKKCLMICLLLLAFQPVNANAMKLYNRLELVLPQANQGDAQAQFNVGVIYMLGWNQSIDYAEALKWFQKSAAQGHINSIYNIGVFYSDGMGVAVDYSEAAKWLEKAAEKGHSKAQRRLSDLYGVGYGVEKNEMKMLYWREKSFENGDADDQYDLAVYYMDNPHLDQSRAVYWLEKSANQGYADAQNTLGIKYLLDNDLVRANDLLEKAFNNGVESAAIYLAEIHRNWNIPVSRYVNVDYKKFAEQDFGLAQYHLGIELDEKGHFYAAFDWFKRAAEKGSANAQTNLAIYYFHGLLGRNDYVKAREWFEKAALQNDVQAQQNLGILYRYGLGGEENWIQAEKWLKLAAEQGNAPAQRKLAELYTEKGYMSLYNLEKSAYWYQKAAEQGDEESLPYLAFFYLRGKGVDKDPNKAVQILLKFADRENPAIELLLADAFSQSNQPERAVYWLEKSAEHGLSESQVLLGRLYFYGHIVPEDYKKAKEWFELAMQQNNMEAASMLSIMYLEGKGVEKSMEKAMELIIKAANANDPLAQYLLAHKMLEENNVESALKLLNQSASNQFDMAKFSLALIYEDGSIVKKDSQKSRLLLEEVPEQTRNFMKSRSLSKLQEDKAESIKIEAK